MKNNALYALLGLTLLTCASLASASPNPQSPVPELIETGFTGPPSQPNGTYLTQSFNNGITGFNGSELSFVYGELYATGAGTVTYTYLGSEAGYTNTFSSNGTLDFTGHSSTVDSSVTESVNGGALNFNFGTLSPSYSISNGVVVTNTTDRGYGDNQGVFGIAGPTSVNNHSYQYVLIYNDPVNGGDHDYNDLVVGVNFTSPVPEPQTYAMLLAGLGLIGFMVSRKKSV